MIPSHHHWPLILATAANYGALGHKQNRTNQNNVYILFILKCGQWHFCVNKYSLYLMFYGIISSWQNVCHSSASSVELSLLSRTRSFVITRLHILFIRIEWLARAVVRQHCMFSAKTMWPVLHCQFFTSTPVMQERKPFGIRHSPIGHSNKLNPHPRIPALTVIMLKLSKTVFDLSFNLLDNQKDISAVPRQYRCASGI